ncbi:MAG: hypothetical protein SF182_16275 [Deltaproteobacteria bacterium]|nr:hypothetical protein [Deltaproteobacteria bacterium]
MGAANRKTKPTPPTTAKSDAKMARSRRLHEAGFANLAEAAACSEAVMADLEAGRIDATEANRINNAVGLWRRIHTSKGGR